MNAVSLDSPQRLDEDLQIIHATLETIVQEVRRFSGDAGEAVTVAIDQVDAAHRALAQVRPMGR